MGWKMNAGRIMEGEGCLSQHNNRKGKELSMVSQYGRREGWRRKGAWLNGVCGGMGVWNF